jgi:hypothetical protein
MLLGEVAPRSDSPCIHCHLYQNDAMTKLVDSMPAPILIRRLLSARIGSGVLRGARKASSVMRRMRAWRNRRLATS